MINSIKSLFTHTAPPIVIKTGLRELFSKGDKHEIRDFIMSTIDDQLLCDGTKGRASGCLLAILDVLVYLRDVGTIELTPSTLGNYLQLEKMSDLFTKDYIDPTVTRNLNLYLSELPGFTYEPIIDKTREIHNITVAEIYKVLNQEITVYATHLTCLDPKLCLQAYVIFSNDSPPHNLEVELAFILDEIQKRFTDNLKLPTRDSYLKTEYPLFLSSVDSNGYVSVKTKQYYN